MKSRLVQKILFRLGYVRDRNLLWYGRAEHGEFDPLKEDDIEAIREWSMHGQPTSSEFTLGLIATIDALTKSLTISPDTTIMRGQ